MTLTPLRNALLAELYIMVIASGMFYASHIFGDSESAIIPIAMLSLFVLSASLMGYLFCYAPAALYFEGKKEEAVQFFLSTVFYFAGITLGVFALLFFVSNI